MKTTSIEIIIDIYDIIVWSIIFFLHTFAPQKKEVLYFIKRISVEIKRQLKYVLKSPH